MHVTVKFNLPEENETFKQFFAGPVYKSVLDDIAEKVFRPARKHGYPEGNIKTLIDKIGDDAIDLIGLLEDKFYQILQDNEVTL